MKLKKSLPLVIIGILFFASCKKQSDPVTIYQEVSFSFSPLEEGGRLHETPTADKIRFSLEKAGEIIFDQHDLDLTAFGNSYITSPVNLEIGTYTLTYFIVLDDSDKVIYAAPMEGSEKQDFVNDPLPITIEVQADQTTTVQPEVLKVESEENPTQFGYVSFGFEVVNTLLLNISAVSDWDSAFVNAIWEFTGFDEDSTLIDVSSVSYKKNGQEYAILSSDAAFYKISAANDDYYTVEHYFETSYLSSTKQVAYSMSPHAHLQKFVLSIPSFGLNEIGLYLPWDGCSSYGRLDATGLASMDDDGFWLFMDRLVKDYHTNENLLLPNMIETFSNPNLIYSTGYTASSAPNECDEFPDNDMLMDVMVIADIMDELIFTNMIWDSIDQEWNASESSFEDQGVPAGRSKNSLLNR